MIKKIANYFSLLLLSIGFVSHVLKLIYLYYKPSFLTKMKYLFNEKTSRAELILYYILTIGCCFYGISNLLNLG